jgi:hypothetical protein
VRSAVAACAFVLGACGGPSSAPRAPAPVPTVTVSAAPPSAQPVADAAAGAAAAIVWIPDERAPGGHRSAWIEPDGQGGAKVVAERAEIVFARADALFLVRPRAVASLACEECPDPAAPRARKGRSTPTPLASPVLAAVGAAQTFEPWADAFRARRGCDDGVGEHTVSVTFDGGAGPYVFATVDTYEQPCSAPHGAYDTRAILLDLRTGTAAKLDPPRAATADLAKHAERTLLDGACPADTGEAARLWRVHAEYRPTGALVGLYDFTMSAPYVCGTGPGHYSVLATEASDALPPELAPFARLPSWVASHLARSRARHAFVVPKERLADFRGAAR